MGNHYVPQHYLRGFATHNEIWVYDKVELDPFLTQVKTIGNENAMYPPELESYFANLIEGPANGVIDKIRKRTNLDDADRLALAKYIEVLVKRVPDGRKRIADLIPETSAEIKAEFIQALAAEVSRDPSFGVIAAEKRIAIEKAVQAIQENPPAEIWQKSLLSGPSQRVVDTILSMSWRFLFAADSQFLSCDNPVFFFRDEGIGSPNSELTLPISSDVTLWANHRPLTEPPFIVTTRAAIRTLNSRTASIATRFVYAKRDERWILPFVRKPKFKLMRLA